MSSEPPQAPPFHLNDLIQETQNSHADLLRSYHDLQRELQGFRNESMQTFEELVTNIYQLKSKNTEIFLMESIEVNITPQAIETIIRKVLAQVCDTHKQLIGEQMRFMLQAGAAEHYYKVQADAPALGFFDKCTPHEWVSQSDLTPHEFELSSVHSTRLNVNNQYYEYCVWVIYHHYCSLSESNKQICLLVETIKQSSEAQIYSFYRQMQAKRMIAELEEVVGLQNYNKDSNSKAQKNYKQQLKRLKLREAEVLAEMQEAEGLKNGKKKNKAELHAQKLARLKLREEEALNSSNKMGQEKDLYSPSYDDLTNFPSFSNPDKMTNLIDEYDLIRESELNILTISNLIPLAIPKIDSHSAEETPSCPEFQPYEFLYYHINKFEQTIANIINKTKQNMRKHCVYLQDFKRAIVILRSRLKSIRAGHCKKRSLQRQKYIQQQMMMEEQYKNSVSRELDLQLRADQEEDCEDQSQLVREIDQDGHREPRPPSESSKTVSSSSDKKSNSKKSKLLSNLTQKTSGSAAQTSDAPLIFGDTDLLFKKQKSEQNPSQRSSGRKFEKGFGLSYDRKFLDTIINIQKQTPSCISGKWASSTTSQGKNSKLVRNLQMIIDNGNEKPNGDDFGTVLAHLGNIQATKDLFSQDHHILRQELKFSAIARTNFDKEQIQSLHEFIKRSNFKDEREEDDEMEEEMDEDYLKRQAEEQRRKKRNKRKKNKKKKKQQQKSLQSQEPQQDHQEKALSQEDTMQESNLVLQKSKSNSYPDEDTPESRVIKWLKELNINEKQRETCYPIPMDVIRGWQAQLANTCNRQKLISLSRSPKKQSRGKKGIANC